MKSVSAIGYWSGLAAFFFTLSYSIVQVMQVAGWLKFPADEMLIYGTSLCIVIPFILEVLALHYTVPAGKKFHTHAALIFTMLYAVFVTANYVVQLATVLPAKLGGGVKDMRILEQTPHSLFWDFDALGYIFMGLAIFAAAMVFENRGFQKKVKICLFVHAAVTPLITIVYFYPVYSARLLFLGFPWAITAPLAMLMLALFYKKHNTPKHETK